MSSRLARDSHGRLVCIVTTPSPRLEHGQRFVVLGNQIECAGTGISFVGAPTGRKPEPIDRQPRPNEGRTGTVRQTWPAEYPDRARELHGQGLSCPRVAAELGIPFGTAKSWIWPVAVGHTSP